MLNERAKVVGVLATLVAASFLVFTHPVSGYIFDGNEFNPQSFASGTAISIGSAANSDGEQWLAPRDRTGGDGFRRTSYDLQGGVSGASISVFADAAAAWGTLDGTIFASGAWDGNQGRSVAQHETQFYDTCRVVSDTIPVGSPVVIHLNWTMRGTFSHLTPGYLNGLARLDLLRGVYTSEGVPYGWERLFLEEWSSPYTTSVNEKGTIQLSDLSVGESFTFTASQLLWGSAPVRTTPQISGIHTSVTDFVSIVVPIVHGDVDASLVCNGLSEWKQQFAQWKAKHCSPGIPQREMSVVFIPSRTKQALPTLAFDEVVERIEYLEEYYYQQSMCSLVLNTFTIQDPNTDGWVELPRTKAEYDLIPGDGANNFVRAANIWLDAFFAAVAVEPVFLLNQQIGVDAVFVINTDSDIRARAFITKGLAPRVDIVATILEFILPSPVGTALKTAKYLGCALGTVLDDLLLSCLLTTMFKQGSIIAPDAIPTGVWAHELGHGLLTLWDLYGTVEPMVRGDIRGFRARSPIDERNSDHGWGLMAGAYNVPPPPIILHNRERAGWLRYRDITPDLYGDYQLVSLADVTFGSDVLRVKPLRANPGADWFIVELRNPPDEVPRAPEQKRIRGTWETVLFDPMSNVTRLTDTGPEVRPFGARDWQRNRFLQPNQARPNLFQILNSTGSTISINGDQRGIVAVGNSYEIDLPNATELTTGSWESIAFDGTNTVLIDNAPDPAPFAIVRDVQRPAIVRAQTGRSDFFRILSFTDSTITITGDQRGIARVGGGFQIVALDTTPGHGNVGVVLYGKREIGSGPVCGSLRGLNLSLVDTALDNDFGSCLWKVTNPSVSSLNRTDRFTLVPGSSYADDPAGVRFSLGNDLILSISEWNPTSTIQVSVESNFTAEPVPSSGSQPAVLFGSDLELPIDLHVFAADGSHVGPNYGSGGYELEVNGARAGGVGTSFQWISVPDTLQATYVVDASQAVVAAAAFGIQNLEINATVSVVAYDANGVSRQLQEPILFELDFERPKTAPVETADTIVPSWPAGSTLTASNVGPTSLTLTWTSAEDNFGIAGYRIYLDTALLATLPGAVHTYDVTSLVPGAQYTFKVEAGDLAGNWGTDGPVLTVRTSATPSAPRILQASAGDRQVTLTWQTPAAPGDSPVSGYRIYRGTSPGGEAFLVQVGNVLTYADTGLTNGVTYYYQAGAVSAIGEGPRSNEISATPTVPPDTTNPTVVIASPVSGTTLASTTVTVSGTASDDVGVQKVELSTDGSTWILAQGTTSWSGSLTLHEGVNTIYVRVTDTAGNPATETISVTVKTEGLSLLATISIAAVVAASSAVGAFLIRRRKRRARKGPNH